jgi:hypothetical protein
MLACVKQEYGQTNAKHITQMLVVSDMKHVDGQTLSSNTESNT